MLNEQEDGLVDDMDLRMEEGDTLLNEGMTDSAVPITGSPQPHGAVPTSSMCGCLTVQYYQPFFDVDTTDVIARLKAVVQFYQKEPTFLSTVGKNPDLYGPFWISTTLIFVIAATSNLSRAWKLGSTYDFQLVTFCMSLIYGYMLLVPSFLWAACKYFLNIPVGFMQLLCLFGYSLGLYIPCSVLATVSLLSWPSIIAATAASTVFVLRSLLPIFAQRREKAMTVLLIMVGIQVAFMLVMKLKFFAHGSW